MYVPMYLFIYVPVNLCIYVCIFVCIYVSANVCTYAGKSVGKSRQPEMCAYMTHVCVHAHQDSSQQANESATLRLRNSIM